MVPSRNENESHSENGRFLSSTTDLPCQCSTGGKRKGSNFLPCEMVKSGLLTTRLFRKDGWAVMEVQETGKGIDPEQLPHIFKSVF